MPAEQDPGRDEREIRKIAYELWQRDGQPEGRDHEHWTEAKEIWAFRSRDSETEGAAAEEAEAPPADVGQPAAEPDQPARGSGSTSRSAKSTSGKGVI